MNVNKLEGSEYYFEDFRLVPGERLLKRDGEVVPLPPKVFDALLLLVEYQGHLIQKDDFFDSLWPDTIVEEATLARTISSLRKALGESPDNRLIETVPKSGYRFVGQVKCVGADDESRFDEFAVSRIPGKFADSDNVSDSAATLSGADDSQPLSPLKSVLSRPVISIAGIAVIVCGAAIFLSWNPRTDPLDEIGSIAVLPFSQIGADDADEMLEFGMTDALITRLSNLKRIEVRPTSAISKYAGKKIDAVQIGKELIVDAVLEGTIQQNEKRVRVNVQLIRTADGQSLWAEHFDSDARDIFDLQDSISGQTVRVLPLRIGAEERALMAKNATTNKDAYRLYITGRYLWSKRTVASLHGSIKQYKRALEIDPEYALAYAGMADCYQLLAEYLAVTPKEGFSKAKSAARRALEIDDTLAEAHTSLAYSLAFYDWAWDEAEKEFKRSLELDPNYATTHQWYGEFLAAMGRFDDAKFEFDRASELDPTSLIIKSDLAGYYFLTRQFEKAIDQSKIINTMDPNFGYGYVFLWFSLGQQGKELESANAFIKSTELFGEVDEAAVLGSVLSTGGVKAMWLKRLEQINSPTRKASFSPMWRALFYLRTGEKDKALDWFEESFERRERWVINMKFSPEIDSVRSEPRMQALLKRIGVE